MTHLGVYVYTYVCIYTWCIGMYINISIYIYTYNYAHICIYRTCLHIFLGLLSGSPAGLTLIRVLTSRDATFTPPNCQTHNSQAIHLGLGFRVWDAGFRVNSPNIQINK